MTSRISVTLPSTTEYVTGTVNGVTTTWTNTHDNVWETNAVRVFSGVYRLHLYLYQSSGLVVEQDLVAALYYEPALMNAYWTVNPVYERHKTILRVFADDFVFEPYEEIPCAGEFAAGEV